MPPTPSPSYLAEGEVITSTFTISEPGKPFNASFTFRANMDVSLPLSRTLKLLWPLTEILPEPSTVTKGVFLKISIADSVLANGSFSTLNTILSSSNSTNGFLASTFTPLSSVPFLASVITPKSMGWSKVMVTCCCFDIKPVWVICSK